MAGVESVLLWAVPNVSAEFACWARRSLESFGRTRSGRRWQAVAGRRRRWWAACRGLGAGRGGRRLPGALLRSLRSCSDKFQQSFAQIQFIDSGWTFLLCCSDVYPQCKLQMTVEIFLVLLLDWLLTCPLLCSATCAVLGCQGRRHLRRGADADSHGPDSSEKHGDSPVAVH